MVSNKYYPKKETNKLIFISVSGGYIPNKRKGINKLFKKLEAHGIKN